ncbi:hypothetical protein CDD83_7988 [Cordyceps sp. RAO-2017]|nr:hypothetical protein CDD83_7988 [Cordyceps sp. RAO-2017]
MMKTYLLLSAVAFCAATVRCAASACVICTKTPNLVNVEPRPTSPGGWHYMYGGLVGSDWCISVVGKKFKVPAWCERYLGTERFCKETAKTAKKRKDCINARKSPPFWDENVLTDAECKVDSARETEKCMGTTKWCKRKAIQALYGPENACVQHRNRTERPFMPWTYGSKSHCDMMDTLATTCQVTFNYWHYGSQVRNFCRDGDCGAWWGRMDMSYWLQKYRHPKNYDEEERWRKTNKNWDTLNKEADELTGAEWRVACARVVSEREACQLDPNRDLPLMRLPTWRREAAIQLYKDKMKKPLKLIGSPDPYKIHKSFRDEAEWERAGGKVVKQAWRLRLLKLEDDRPRWEDWFSSLMNMTGLAQGR